MSPIEFSIVVPVFNEEKSLSELFSRMLSTMDALERPYEIIFINDGSRDGSLSLLEGFHERRPELVCIIDLNGNYGQHTAIIAGFEKARGLYAITLDADLQNPPEEIPKLIELLDQGHDVVGGIRAQRKDSIGRRACSKLMNIVRERATGMHMTDQGCMLRAYNRNIYSAIADSAERALFIPGLAQTFASNPGEVEVNHSERLNGNSSYSYYQLIRLNFDLITGFSLAPLQLFTLFGFVVSGLSALLVVHLVARRIFLGPEVEGVFTLFAILFFLVSVAITGIGLVGEYVGRTFQAAQGRPRYLTKKIINAEEAAHRVLFFGYSEMGYRALEKLLDRGVHITAVFTHEDDPHENRWFGSVEKLARSRGIPIYKPQSLTHPSLVETIRALDPDIIFSFYYRKLIPMSILELAPLGAYNMHGSLLPQYRGKAPVNWAVLRGERESGATLHVMVEKPDAGDIVDQESVPIGPDDTSRMVMKKVINAAIKILDRQLNSLLSGRANLRPQNHNKATYFGGRTPEDGRIDWSQSAEQIHNLIRAVSQPYPGAFTEAKAGKLFVWRSCIQSSNRKNEVGPGVIVSCEPLVVSTGDGFLELVEYEWIPQKPTDEKFVAPQLEVGAPIFHPAKLQNQTTAT